MGYLTTLYNSIASGNQGRDTYLCTSFFSCAPDLSHGQSGNITNAPLFANPAGGDYSLSLVSPCINAGTNRPGLAEAQDLAGRPRILPAGGRVDMGAFEVPPAGPISVTLTASYTNAAVGMPLWFEAAVQGCAIGIHWAWGDSTTTSISNVFSARHAYAIAGQYTVLATVWNEDTTNTVQLSLTISEFVTRYVSVAGGHVPPFTNWAEAATNIQAAIDASLVGHRVLVASGVYTNGGAQAEGRSTRVSLFRPVVVQSVNGPDQTVIQPDGRTDRGAFVGDGSLLSGFTIQGFHDTGVYCSSLGVVSNCVITGNWSPGGAGGGVYGGTVLRSIVRANYAGGRGGGTADAWLDNCLIVANTSGIPNPNNPGGFDYGAGGGCWGGTLRNCTVVGNSGNAGGTYGSALGNCIVYGNTNGYGGPDVVGGTANFTCSPSVLTNGIGNFTNAPLFVNAAAGDFRLAAGSPGINAGTNQDWMIGELDLAGLPRIADGVVDVGAYEYGSQIPATFKVTASFLLSPERLRLEWPSVPGFSYQLQSATNLPAASWLSEGAPFPGTGGVLATNLPLGPEPGKFFRLRLSE